MKKLKFITMALLGLSLIGFNSCLGDDDDDEDVYYLTSSEKATCYSQVQGYHSGSMVYATDYESSTTDTTTCTINITGEIEGSEYVYKMYIYGFPIKALAYNMSDGDCKTAMEEAENVLLETTIDFYSTSPVSWFINPVAPEFTLEYGGTTHTIQVPFIQNNYYSIGAYGTVSTTSSTTIKQIQMRIFAAAIYVDGEQTSLLDDYTQFYFEATVD